MGAFRTALVAFAIGCSAQVDWTDTAYLCPDDRCPPGYTCFEGRCVEELPGPDGGTGDGGPMPGALVTVAAGDFTMGCPAIDNPGCPLDTLPPHTVTLPAFEIERTEVTQAAWQACIDAGGCVPPATPFAPATTPDAPVTGVTWEQAQAYCAFVGRRLPTEAEWEKAARGADERRYPWGDATPDCTRANYSACGGDPADTGTHDLGVSPYGAVDMAGNVAEWVSDWYSEAYYIISPGDDPPGPATGSARVIRGGSFASTSSDLRAYVRDNAPPGTASEPVGFRCARR